jgi:glycolate oxidase iron-sulfur subunit
MFGWLGAGLNRAEKFSALIPNEFLRERLARRAPTARSSKRATYFIGCGVNFMFPRVGEATVAVLEALGYETKIVEHGCCGLPAFSNGALEAARRLALRNIEALSDESDSLVIADCSSCASFLKDYPALFSIEAADDAARARAQRFSARVRDVTEILAEASGLFRAESGERPAVGQAVTFHEPCHLGRRQRLGDRAREVLRAMPDVEFVEMKEAAWCCGGAGAFAIEHPELSLAILERKIRRVESSRAATIATTCPSCLMQIGGGAAEAGLKIRARHLVEMARERLPDAQDAQE